MIPLHQEKQERKRMVGGSLNAFLAETNAWEKHEPIFKGSWAKYTKIYRLATIIVPKSATAKKLHNKTNTTKEDTHFKGHIYHHFLFFVLWSVSNVPHYLFTQKNTLSIFGIVSFLGKKLQFFVPMKSFPDCKTNIQLKKREKKRQKDSFAPAMSHHQCVNCSCTGGVLGAYRIKGFVQKSIYLLWHKKQLLLSIQNKIQAEFLCSSYGKFGLEQDFSVHDDIWNCVMLWQWDPTTYTIETPLPTL